MLSNTLNELLQTYRLGSKIRALRLGKGLGLAQLGAPSGLSAGMLSKFFADSREPVLAVVRKEDRLSLPDRPDRQAAFHFESLDFPVTERSMESYLVRFPAGAAPSEPHQHAGDEMIYVVAGALEVLIHGRTHRLAAGDSMYFEADYPHRYAAPDQGGCEAIVVVAAVR